MRTYMALALAAVISGSFAGDIRLPADGDIYSTQVAKAAAHDPDTDFRALRFGWLDSKARARGGDDDVLRQEMFTAANAGEDTTVRDKAEQILSIDYTDLWGHKLLRQSCAVLKDDACAELHHFVEFGLLDSIIHSGDGKSCKTGWEAVQVKEEYFVLGMMGIKFERQALVMADGHTCDAMQGTDEKGATVTYYFNIDAMWADEAKMFQK